VKRYVGIRTPHRCTVKVINDMPLCSDYPLDPRYDLRTFSQEGYHWGNPGSGAAQLAVALLADALDSDELAQKFYQDFKLKVIARLEQDHWKMTQDDIRQLAAQLEAERSRRR
jgi:hypothetical protein